MIINTPVRQLCQIISGLLRDFLVLFALSWIDVKFYRTAFLGTYHDDDDAVYFSSWSTNVFNCPNINPQG